MRDTALEDIEAAKEMLHETSDADEKAMLQEDISANEAKLPELEAEVHRVQRVPKTESQGRIQTSTATVAVLPEADEIELEKQQAELGAERQSQIGHGNRSEKIRTYNQPQDRVTDHRIGFNSTYNGVLLGDGLSSVIEALAAADRAEKLAQQV